MPIGGRKVLPVAVEKEQARVASTISGREVDLPAMWNRMFEPRVLTDYGPEGFAAIAKLPGGESLEWCYGCGKCTPVCPVDMVGEYGPRKIHRKVQTGTDLFSCRRPMALHRLRELPSGVPEEGRHARDHAGRPRGGAERCRGAG